MNKFSKSLVAVLFAMLLVLAACGGGSNDGNNNSGSDNNAANNNANDNSNNASDDGLLNIEDFDTRGETGDPTEGGTLNFGLVSDTVFEGTLNWNFYGGAPDAEVLGWFDEPLLYADENYQYTQDGPATFEHSDDYTEWTFTIRDDVNWHDGEPVTAEDWKFAYEVISHPDYDGPRYGEDFTIIEGVVDYHNGEADSISGIEVVDEKTLKITYDTPTPSLLAGGIWPYALAKHIFEDIEVADMSSSDEVRKNPIGIGPFKVESITSGESVVYSKNEDYWQGEPILDEVVLRVVDPSVVAEELSSGNIDLADSFPADSVVDHIDMEGVDFLADVDNAYTYVGFKLGTWDADEKRVNYDPDNSKVGDVELRRAMWYAVDNDAVGEEFYDGLRWGANALIVPTHEDFHYEDLEAPTFDQDKANEILDEAGYEWVDGEEFRRNPDGEEFTLNFASMSGGDTAEPIANYYLQSWQAVGLDVQLLDGRLQEFNTFYDRVGDGGNDDPEVDVYMGAWSVGSDVDPTGLYGETAMFNFSRYANDKNTELLKDGVSDEAFDVDYRIDVYKEWQELMVEEIPVFPTLYRASVVPVSENLLNFTIDSSDNPNLHEIGFKE